nr:RNA-directed DNA polymerase, eukaryota [Tanacetum cinerariifolium]
MHEMEMIRSNCFKGTAHSERKISWVSWGKVLASKKYGEASVATKLVSPSIDESFRRSVRDGAERFQWRDLCEVIDFVTLSSSKDKWMCDLSGDGEFRVKEIVKSQLRLEMYVLEQLLQSTHNKLVVVVPSPQNMEPGRTALLLHKFIQMIDDTLMMLWQRRGDDDDGVRVAAVGDGATGERVARDGE